MIKVYTPIIVNLKLSFKIHEVKTDRTKRRNRQMHNYG